MPRLRFEKTGNAVWISHLDLMRLFQRAFKRAGLPLKHTQGFNPRPSVSIAMPLSVGVHSQCELLDFELDGESVPNHDICMRLNDALVNGVRVLEVYDNGCKLKDLSLLACRIEVEYDAGNAAAAMEDIQALFLRDSLPVTKKGKNGPVQQDIIPMIRKLDVASPNDHLIVLNALISCQNPSLNPMQLVAAVEHYFPHWKPDYAVCRRMELYNANEKIFR